MEERPQTSGALVGKRQDKAGRWRSAKVPGYSTDPVLGYANNERMKQLGRLDRYQKELAKITRAKIFPLSGLPRISVAGLLSNCEIVPPGITVLTTPTRAPIAESGEKTDPIKNADLMSPVVDGG